MQVPDLPAFDSISSGDSMCAQQTNGAVYCSKLRAGGDQMSGFREVPALFGAADVVSGRTEICGRFEDLTVRCVGRVQDSSEDEAGVVAWTGVEWIERSGSRGDSEGWCAGFDDGTTSCSWGSPLADGLIALDGDEFRGASDAFETNGTLCGVLRTEVRCIDDFGVAGIEPVVRTEPGFGDVVTTGSGRTWACVAEQDGRVQYLGEARGALGDAGATRTSVTPLVVAESAVPHPLRRLVYGLFGGLAVLGAWVMLRGETTAKAAA